MKIVIIDDEQAMHLILRRMLAKVEDMDIVGSFTETASAFAYLVKHEVDLVLVDINMPREGGMEFAQRLRENGKQTKLVFITSHKEYALSAFDVHAFDYMVKPVVQDRLHATVRRARATLRMERLFQAEPATDATAAFNCLGGIELLSAQGDRVKWRSSKSAELFAYLLLHRGRLVSRARLIEDLFGDMPLKNAETYLNTTVYQLRKALDSVGLKNNLQSDSHRYALNLDATRVDLLAFEEGCLRMALIDETNIEQAQELEQLYKGNLFGDRAFDWAWSEVERLSQLHTSFTQRLGAALLNKGESNAAIRLLLKLLTDNELDEQTVMLLMKAWALQKNKEALTKQFSRFTDTLRDEIGVRPSPEVVSLYEQLLSDFG
ncbi:response regulator [Cohnella yongneupensis]|uniref:Response regulator n=1 Tax=Cohnella yongneupensis TaxID=425006 RepID=A0ABW0R2K8_9BACL